MYQGSALIYASGRTWERDDAQAFADIFEDPIGQVLLDNKRLKLLIFDEIEEVILRWIG
ncbi:MAG: hypothetical protein ACKPAE_17340 [Microcystis panniformis]